MSEAKANSTNTSATTPAGSAADAITTRAELERYQRQMLLPVIGEEGQRRLRQAKVLVVGCGGLGTTIVNMLGRAGVGELLVADRDFVDISNLQRQVLFDEADVRESLPKAEAARRKLAAINPAVKVTAVVDDVNHTNVERLAVGCDLIADGVDNFETRFLLNDCAVKLGLPYIYGGAVGTTGLCFTVLPRTANGGSASELGGVSTPCLRCLFDQAPPPGTAATCDTVGVLGPIVGIVANYQAAEAIKVLTGNWGALNPTMLSVDVWANTVRQLNMGGPHEAVDCLCCKRRRFEYLEGKYASGATTLCGRNAVQLTQSVSSAQVDLEAVARRLRSRGEVKLNKFMLRVGVMDGGQPFELTLFPNGRTIIKGTSDQKLAKSLYSRYIGV